MDSQRVIIIILLQIIAISRLCHAECEYLNINGATISGTLVQCYEQEDAVIGTTICQFSTPGNTTIELQDNADIKITEFISLTTTYDIDNDVTIITAEVIGSIDDYTDSVATPYLMGGITCDSNPYDIYLYIFINTVNDHQPSFFQNSYSISNVIETFPPNIDLLQYFNVQIYASDADTPGDSTSQLDFSIIDGNTDGTFSFNSVSYNTEYMGQLFVVGSLDYQTHPSYDLTIQVTDKGNPAKSNTATLSITIQDADNLDPKFDSNFYYADVSDFVNDGLHQLTTSPGPILATDQDSLNAPIEYSLLIDDCPTCSAILAAFTIDQNTGVITYDSSVDMSTINNNVATFGVQATQKDNSYRSTLAIVSVTVFAAVPQTTTTPPTTTVTTVTDADTTTVTTCTTQTQPTEPTGTTPTGEPCTCPTDTTGTTIIVTTDCPTETTVTTSQFPTTTSPLTVTTNSGTTLTVTFTDTTVTAPTAATTSYTCNPTDITTPSTPTGATCNTDSTFTNTGTQTTTDKFTSSTPQTSTTTVTSTSFTGSSHTTATQESSSAWPTDSTTFPTGMTCYPTGTEPQPTDSSTTGSSDHTDCQPCTCPTDTPPITCPTDVPTTSCPPCPTTVEPISCPTDTPPITCPTDVPTTSCPVCPTDTPPVTCPTDVPTTSCPVCPTDTPPITCPTDVPTTSCPVCPTDTPPITCPTDAPTTSCPPCPTTSCPQCPTTVAPTPCPTPEPLPPYTGNITVFSIISVFTPISTKVISLQSSKSDATFQLYDESSFIYDPAFQLDNSNGIISVADYLQVGKSYTYAIQSSYSEYATVNFNVVNDEDVYQGAFEDSYLEWTIQENSKETNSYTFKSIYDGENESPTYSVISIDRTLQGAFAMNPDNGILTVNGTWLDYESMTSCMVIVEVIFADATNTHKYNTYLKLSETKDSEFNITKNQELVKIIITDADDQTPIFQSNDMEIENLAIGISSYTSSSQEIVQIQTTDADTDPQNKIVYYSINSQPDFYIDAISGLLFASTSISDLQDLCTTKNQYDLTVTAINNQTTLNVNTLKVTIYILQQTQILVIYANYDVKYFDENQYQIFADLSASLNQGVNSYLRASSQYTFQSLKYEAYNDTCTKVYLYVLGDDMPLDRTTLMSLVNDNSQAFSSNNFDASSAKTFDQTPEASQNSAVIEESDNTGYIVGISILAVLLVVCLIVGGVYGYKMHKVNKKKKELSKGHEENVFGSNHEIKMPSEYENRGQLPRLSQAVNQFHVNNIEHDRHSILEEETLEHEVISEMNNLYPSLTEVAVGNMNDRPIPSIHDSPKINHNISKSVIDMSGDEEEITKSILVNAGADPKDTLEDLQAKEDLTVSFNDFAEVIAVSGSGREEDAELSDEDGGED